MFKLLRHFSLTSAFAIVSVTVVLVLLYRQNAVHDLVETAESENVTLARAFANTIWPRFSSYVTSVSGLDGDALRARPETMEFRKVLKALTAGLPVLKIEIYNLDGIAVFSTEATEIGGDKRENRNFFAAARDGKTASNLARKHHFSTFSGDVLDRVLVESYLPIRRGDGPVEGVFELYTDVTPLMDRIQRSTGRLLIGLLVTFGALYAVLFLIIRRADGILKRQHATLKREVAERKRAEEALQAANEQLEQRVEERTRTLTQEIAGRKRVERALRESEARMRDLLEYTSDWVWHMDADLRFSYFSRRFPEVTGIRPEELLGRTRLELGQGDVDDDKWRRHLADLEARRPFRDFRYKFVHRDGRTLHFLVNGKPVFDEAGAFLGYRGVGTDITARVEAEEQARSARERLALAVDGLAELFALFDADDRIVLTNAAWREMNEDIAEAAGPGTRFEDFLRAAVEAGLIPEAVGREEEWLRWRIDLHRNPQGPFEIQRQNGRWILINEQCLPDGGTVLIVSDITERKRAEEALRETERRFRNLVDGSVQGILIHQDRRPVYVNRAWAEIHGYTVAEVLAMDSVIPLIAPSEHARMAKYRKRRMEGGEAPSWYEYEAVRKDGTHIWLENMATVVTWKDEPAIQSTIVDITERKRAEEAVRRSEERLRGAVESLQEGFALFDAEDRLVLINDEYRRVNPVAQEMLEKGLHYEDVLRANVKRGMIVEAIGREDEFIRERLHRHRNPTGPILRQFTNGMWYLIKEARTPEGGIALTFVDITKQKMIEEQIRRQANYDSLTDLPNRTLFMDRLSRALVAARRDNELVALLFIDLDRFKVVNDTLGHVVGDRLLEKAAERLRGCVREVDTVARLGGDEFTIILQNIAKPEDAAVVAQKVIESLAAPFSLENHEAFIGASIGITVFPTDADNASTLLRNADVAMYRAKDAGRNEYRFFTKEMDAHALTRLSLENDLRYALEREQFFVHYQPIVDLQSGGVVSAEALVRWRHPRRGLVPPDEFIPLAEESGLIAPLGEWVLRTACAQAGAWQNMDLPAFGISVNLSSGQLKRGLSHEFIARVLRDAGISPELLTFEITESLIMEDTNEAITWLHAVKDMGVSLSIDDFGTGYSSLSYLKRFPVDSVKIDRSFVGDVTDDPEDASLADAIIALAHNLGLTVIAEGVETKEQLAFLQARGCDLYQGYYFGKPMTAGELEEKIRNDRWSEFSGSTPPSPRPAKRRDAGTRRRPARRARGKDQAASPSARGRSLQSKKRP